MGDGTDRIVPGVETVQLKELLTKLCKKSNIIICEGISQLVFNVPMISFAAKIGYSLTICEISTDKVTRKNIWWIEVIHGEKQYLWTIEMKIDGKTYVICFI